MLLEGTRIAQVGCGVAGDIAGALLARLGAEVTRVALAPCPLCGDACDRDEPWRARYGAGKRIVVSTPAAFLEAAAAGGRPPYDGVIADGVPGAFVDAWREIAGRHGIATVLLVTLDGAEGGRIEAHGLSAEALTGVAGTMGPEGGLPTPFGFLYGETNCAVRGAAALVDALTARALHPDMLPPGIIEVSAADACLDAMDNPWQEYSLPGPIHEGSNPLTERQHARLGPQRAGLVPYGLFPAADAWVCLVGASTTELLADRLQRPELIDDARFGTIEARVANRAFVLDLLGQWIATFESGDAFVEYMGNNAVVARSQPLSEVMERAHDGLLGFGKPTAPYRITIASPGGSVSHAG